MTPTRALIEIAEELRAGMSANCQSEGCTCGDGWSHDDPDLIERLDVAISSAKAAEEGVESTGRVMCMDHEWVDEKPCPYCAASAAQHTGEDLYELIGGYR